MVDLLHVRLTRSELLSLRRKINTSKLKIRQIAYMRGKKDVLLYTENITMALNGRWGKAGHAASYHSGILSLATQLRSQPQPLGLDCLKPAFQTAAIQRCCIRSDLCKLIGLSRNQTKKCIFSFMRHFFFHLLLSCLLSNVKPLKCFKDKVQ